MNINIEKDVKMTDYLVFIVIILMIIARLISYGYVSYMSEVTGTQIEQVVQVFEANPLAKVHSALQNVALLIVNLIMPSAIVALYIYFKRKVLQGKMDVDILVMFTTYILIAISLDVINDISIFIGALL